MPVPEGSWKSEYNRMQSKYNRHLVLGGGFFAFTLLVMCTSGLITLNATIPKLEEGSMGVPQIGGGCLPPPPKCD